MMMRRFEQGQSIFLSCVIFALTVMFIYLVQEPIRLWAQGGQLASDEYVHCFDVVQRENGGIGYLGHPPTDEIFKPQPGETHVATHCFPTWSEAAEYITGGAVKLPLDATQRDYEQATLEYSQQLYQESLEDQR